MFNNSRNYNYNPLASPNLSMIVLVPLGRSGSYQIETTQIGSKHFLSWPYYGSGSVPKATRNPGTPDTVRGARLSVGDYHSKHNTSQHCHATPLPICLYPIAILQIIIAHLRCIHMSSAYLSLMYDNPPSFLLRPATALNWLVRK